MAERGADGGTHRIGNSTITNGSCDLYHYKIQMPRVVLRLSIVPVLHLYHNIYYIYFL